MRKVTIYDGPGGSEVSYIEGVTEPGGVRKVKNISSIGAGVMTVVILFGNGERKDFCGFRCIVDEINDPKTTESK